MEWIKPMILHVIAVVVAVAVALVIANLVGIESQIGQAVLAVILVALEKLVRAVPSIPIPDYTR